MCEIKLIVGAISATEDSGEAAAAAVPSSKHLGIIDAVTADRRTLEMVENAAAAAAVDQDSSSIEEADGGAEMDELRLSNQELESVYVGRMVIIIIIALLLPFPVTIFALYCRCWKKQGMW